MTTNQLCPCQHPRCCRFRKSLAMTGLRDLSKKSTSIFLIPQALQNLSCFPKLPQQRLHLPPLLLRNSSETDILQQNWRRPPTSNSRPVKKGRLGDSRTIRLDNKSWQPWQEIGLTSQELQKMGSARRSVPLHGQSTHNWQLQGILL